MTDEGVPIAYRALSRGVPVVTRGGHRFGTVERVVEDPAEDIFHGIVVATAAGPRLVERDRVDRITTTRVVCAVDDEALAALPSASSAESDESQGQRSRSARTAGSGRPVLIVRCRSGAVFQTVWIPLFSLKAIRLGPIRLQWCPVHQRRELVTPVDPSTLTRAELAQAARYPADPIP